MFGWKLFYFTLDTFVVGYFQSERSKVFLYRGKYSYVP